MSEKNVLQIIVTTNKFVYELYFRVVANRNQRVNRNVFHLRNSSHFIVFLYFT